MYTHRLADRCVKDPEWVSEFLKYVDENPNSCQEVWLCSAYGFPSVEKHREIALSMKPTVDMFRARKIRVALQISNTKGGHAGIKYSDNSGLIHDGWHAPFCVDDEGNDVEYTFCTASKDFRKYLSEVIEAYLSELDVCGVWIDDDFRMGNHTQVCWCDDCISEFSKRVGKEYTRQELVTFVNSDLGVRDEWIEFTAFRYYDAAKFIADSVHRVKPDVYTALQHGANGYMAGAGHKDVFKGFYEGSGVAPHSRPGAGSYEDFDPNTFIGKYRWLSHQTRYLPEYVKDIRPEVENLPDVAYGKTHGGTIFETALYFAGGATSMSYASMMRRNEPLSWLCLQLRAMSENFEWFSKLSRVNMNTHPAGIEVYIPEKPWNYITEKPFEWEEIDFDSGMEIMRQGIPVTLQKTKAVYLLNKNRIKAMTDEEIKTLLSKNVVCDGETVAELTRRGFSELLGVSAEEISTGGIAERLDDEYDWNFNFFFSDGARLTLLSDKAKEVTSYYVVRTQEYAGVASAYAETALGGRWAVVAYRLFSHIMSFAKRNRIVEAFEWVGGKLPAKLTTPERMLLFARVDENERLRAVSVVNTSVGASDTTRLELVGEYHDAEWYSIGKSALRVETDVCNGTTLVTLPKIDGWSVGTLFLN